MTTYYQAYSRKDLEEFGIIFLTGESCPYYLRKLYDLTEEGKRYVEMFFSMDATSRNWNSSQDQVASVMLPNSVIQPLLEFIVHQKHPDSPALKHEGWVYLFNDIEELRDYKSNCEFDGVRIWTPRNQPTRNGRNVHAMTGRSE